MPVSGRQRKRRSRRHARAAGGRPAGKTPGETFARGQEAQRTQGESATSPPDMGRQAPPILRKVCNPAEHRGVNLSAAAALGAMTTERTPRLKLPRGRRGHFQVRLTFYPDALFLSCGVAYGPLSLSREGIPVAEPRVGVLLGALVDVYVMCPACRTRRR